jgi:hypothetical protein
MLYIVCLDNYQFILYGDICLSEISVRRICVLNVIRAIYYIT